MYASNKQKEKQVKITPRFNNNVKRISIAIIFVSAAMFGAAGIARADLPANCVQQPWLYNGLFGRWTTRTICDGPIQPDGSWMRGREFYADETYVPFRCSFGTYSGSCSGGYWLGEFDKVDKYRVTPDTVLPDEPGHIQP